MVPTFDMKNTLKKKVWETADISQQLFKTAKQQALEISGLEKA